MPRWERRRRERAEAVSQVPGKQDRADAPGQRIGPEGDADVGDQAQDHGDVGDTQSAPDRQHDDHGHGGAAQAAQDAGAAMAERQQAVEQRDGAGLPGHRRR